jgi:hypothetical protein
MGVLQLAKRSILTAVAVCTALTGCGESGPEVPFNATGTADDLQAVSSTFESPTFASFSTFSIMFDAALGGAPVISSSAAAIGTRAGGTAGMRAAATRAAKRLAALVPSSATGNVSASLAAIPAEIAGKTFVFDGVSYVPSELPGAPENGVRFMLYAVAPGTFAPVEPLVETGYVDVIDLSSGSTIAARVVVVSGDTEYVNYTVSVSSTSISGRVSILGYVTDGTHRADVNLRSTLTFNAGLTLVYGVDVPTRDLSIDLTLTTSGLDPQTSTIEISLDIRGPNGWIRMTGQFSQSGGTLTVRTGTDLFATITVTGGADPVITGADGQPLTEQDIEAVSRVFELTGEAFGSFDQLVAPVGGFLEPAA